MTGLTEAQWEAMRNAMSREALAAKSSQVALGALLDAYRNFDALDKRVVDEWMAQALLTDDEVARFDALAMIREFGVRSALPQLRTLASRLEVDDSPAAPYEWAKVNRLIAALQAPESP